MSPRFVRLLVAVLVVGGGFAAVAGAAAPLDAAQHPDGTHALTRRCAENVLGLSGISARPVAGSADPQLLAQFALFRRARTAADALPSAANMGRQLAAAGAVSYDPSAAVQVGRPPGLLDGPPATVYAVPAMISPALSSACRAVLGATGVADYLAFQALVTGSGPGACLVTTDSVSAALGPPPPGAPAPAARPTVIEASCESSTILAGYRGALAAPFNRASDIALIPDGISQIAYTFADGIGSTVPVSGNVAMPARPSIPTPPQHPTAGALSRVLAALLPTTVTETETDGGAATVDLARPASLVSDTVWDQLLEERLVGSLGSAGVLSTSSGFGASCSAWTHRCVAVTVTTTCNRNERCRIGRTIHRYRYVTAKPPAGTTGPDTQPTAPIVGRTNRFVRRPRKLTLVLSGAPRQRVDILLSVGCLSRRSSTGEAGPPLHTSVPSRHPIDLPGPAHTFRACDVSALVISHQRGPVHVTVVRG